MKKYTDFDIAMMRRQDHMTIAQIAEKTGLDEAEVRRRIVAYSRATRAYTIESMKRNKVPVWTD